MTIQQRQRHNDVIKYWPKRRNDKDFEDLEKLTYFSHHKDDIQSEQVLVWSKTLSR